MGALKLGPDDGERWRCKVEGGRMYAQREERAEAGSFVSCRVVTVVGCGRGSCSGDSRLVGWMGGSSELGD